MNYVVFSHNFLGSFSRSIKNYFTDVNDDLKKAGIAYTLEEYLSVAIFTVIITFFSETVLISFIFGLLGIDLLISIFLSITLSFSISGILFFLFYSYPSAVSSRRDNEIKKILPFAVSYLSTMSSAKLPPIFLFKTLSKFKEFKDISKEADDIVRDVELFGLSLFSSIKKKANKTPSKEFKEILWGINTITSTGGDLPAFLKQKSINLMEDYSRRIRKYSQDLSLFVEIYLTLIITGSIFFIVLSSVISAISGGLGTIVIQSFVVFILLPLLSIGFILVIKSISPSD